jgi:hypothetical protein
LDTSRENSRAPAGVFMKIRLRLHTVD